MCRSELFNFCRSDKSGKKISVSPTMEGSTFSVRLPKSEFGEAMISEDFFEIVLFKLDSKTGEIFTNAQKHPF